MTKQTGFPSPERNYYQVPHNFVDILSDLNSLAEIKILNYLLRHTWGFHEFDIPKHLKIEEFINGRRVSEDIAKRKGYKYKNGHYRMDKGTGLSRTSVKKGLKEMIQDGLGLEYSNTNDRARIEKFYMLIIIGAPIYKHFEGATLSDYCIEQLKKLGYRENENGDFIWESEKQNPSPQKLRGSDFNPQHFGGQILPPGGQILTPRGSDLDPRTGERNSRKNSCCPPHSPQNSTDLKTIQDINNQIHNAAGEYMDNSFIETLLKQWDVEYIKEKIELARNSKISDTVSGFIYKACMNNWTRSGPKRNNPNKRKKQEADNPDAQKRKEFIKTLYMD